jgi:hypothetical protein
MGVQTSHVKKVSGGSFDVVGDVRGDINELQNLLKELGYSELGEHRDARKLIFVGNLCGQGPKSVDVILLVKKMMEAGNAFSIIGKNELNLLRANAKDGTGWSFDKGLQPDQSNLKPDEAQRKEIVEFLESLPLILECDGLCIVDAVWRDPDIEQIRAGRGIAVIDLYEHSDVRCKECLKRERNEFEEINSFRHHWRLNNVTSVDYSVGGRLAELHDELPVSQISRLAALRWPEQKIVFDSGESVKLKFEFLSYARTEALRVRSKEIRSEFKRPGSTLNLQQAIEAVLNECGYLFGKFEDSSAAEIEVAERSVHDFLHRDDSSYPRRFQIVEEMELVRSQFIANGGKDLELYIRLLEGVDEKFGKVFKSEIQLERFLLTPYEDEDDEVDEFCRERAKIDHRRFYYPLKTDFGYLNIEARNQWVSLVKENYPELDASDHYAVAEKLYYESKTELPRKSWLRKLVAIFR